LFVELLIVVTLVNGGTGTVEHDTCQIFVCGQEFFLVFLNGRGWKLSLAGLSFVEERWVVAP
jgi:hypothetical protein